MDNAFDIPMPSSGTVDSQPSSSSGSIDPFDFSAMLPQESSTTAEPAKPGVFGSFVKGFLSRAPEDLGGGQIAGLGDITGTKWLQHLGEAIENAPSDKLKEDIAKVEQTPWFDESTPWYDVHPSRIPEQLAKVSAMMGTGLPFLMQTMATSWIGKKALSGAAGLAVGAAVPVVGETGASEVALSLGGMIAADVVVPSSVMALGSIHSYYKEQRALGIDDDIIRENALQYGAINGLAMTLRSQAGIGAAAAGTSASIVSKRTADGLRFVVAKMLKSAGVVVPAELEMAGFNVGSMKLMDSFTKKNQEKMQARYADWKPQDKPELTVADYMKTAAEGALFGGSLRAFGFMKRMVRGEVNPELQGKVEEAMNAINPYSKAKVLFRGETEEHIGALVDAFNSKQFAKRMGKLANSGNEQARDTSFIIRDIVAAAKEGRMDDAVNLFDKNARTVTIANDANAQTIVDYVEGKWKDKGAFAKSVDPATGRSYVVADASLLPTDKEAQKLWGSARLRVNYEDVENWKVKLDKDAIANDRTLAEAMQLPHQVDPKTGKVSMSQEASDQLKKTRDVLNGILDSPEGSLHSKSPLSVSYVDSMLMTQEQIGKAGYDHIINGNTKWYKDGLHVYTGAEPRDPEMRAAIKPMASNYFDAEGRIAVDVTHGTVAHEHIVEELLEGPLKQSNANDKRSVNDKTVKDQGRLRELVSKWTMETRARLSKDVTRLESKRKDITKIASPEGRKQELLSQIKEMEGHVATAELPRLVTPDYVLKRLAALRGEAEGAEFKDDNVARAYESRIRDHQREMGLLSDADIAGELHKRFNKAEGMNATQIELFSNYWNLMQFGNGEKLTASEKNMLKYLTFDAKDAVEIKDLLKQIHGEKLYSAMEAGSSPMEVKEFYKSDADLQAERDQAQAMKDKADAEWKKSVDAKFAEISEKIAKGIPLTKEDVLPPKPVVDAKTGADHAPSTDASPRPEVKAETQAEGALVPEDGKAVQEPLGGVKEAKTDETAQQAKEAAVGDPSRVPDPESWEGRKASKLAEAKRVQVEKLADEILRANEEAVDKTLAAIADDSSVSLQREKPEGYDDGSATIREAQSASMRHMAENAKYNKVTDVMVSDFGTRSQAETHLVALLHDNVEIAEIVSDRTSEADFMRWLDTPADANDPNRTTVDSFKLAVQTMMHPDMAKPVTREFVRSMVKQYSAFVPHEHVYQEVQSGRAGSFVDPTRSRSINKTARLAEWKRSVSGRVDSISVNPEKQKAIREEFSKLDIDNKAQASAFLESLTGISRSIWFNANESFWKGMRPALATERGKTESGGYKILKDESEGATGWKRVANDLLLGLSEKAKNIASAKPNIEHLVTGSSDRLSFALHGRDEAGKQRITAAVNSPFLEKVKDYVRSRSRGEAMHEVLSKFTGVKRDGKPMAWDKMTDQMRALTEAGYAARGYLRVIPFGDKTDAYFMKFDMLDHKDALDAYTKIYESRGDSPFKKLMEDPKNLRKRMKAVEADSLNKEVHNGMSVGQWASLSMANQALRSLEMYKLFYGDFKSYTKGGKLTMPKLQKFMYEMVKRGSQIPSGGATYNRPLKVLLLDSFKLGDNDKLADGALFHSDRHAQEFAGEMGSEFNSDVIKPYFRWTSEDGHEWGVKCASTRIGLYESLRRPDGSMDPMYASIKAIFDKHPEIDYIGDKNSAKFFPPETAWVNPLDSEGKFNADMDLTPHIQSVPERSMFIVQNVSKTSDAARDLLSRQMIFATSHLKGGTQRAVIHNQILSLMLKKFDRDFVNGEARPGLLASILKSDRVKDTLDALKTNGESQQNILNNSQVLGAMMNWLQDLMEPKTLRHGSTQVPEGMMQMPGYAKAEQGNHLPWFTGSIRMPSSGDATPLIREARNGSRVDEKGNIIPFASRAEAESYLRENQDFHLDLAQFDDMGAPMENEKGDVVFSGRHIREHEGKFWIPGSIDWNARIPSDSLYSAAPYRLFRNLGTEAGIGMIPEQGKKDNGSDHDADALFGSTFFLDKNGRILFDTNAKRTTKDGREVTDDDAIIRALMNRRLALMTRDYETENLKHLTTDKQFSDGKADLEYLKDMMKRIAAKVGEVSRGALKAKFGEDWEFAHPPITSSEFGNHMLDVYSSGSRMLGIAAKGNSAQDMEQLHGATMAKMTMSAFKVGDVKFPAMTIGLDQQRADELKADFEKRMEQKMIVGRTMINFLVDDAKDPAAYQIMNYDTAGMIMTAMRGMDLSPANREANLTHLLMWANHSPEMKEFNRVMGEIKMGRATTLDLFKTLSNSRAGLNVMKLYGISKARQQVGRVTDLMVSANAPQTVGEAITKMLDLDEVASGSKTYMFPNKNGGWYVSRRIPRNLEAFAKGVVIYNPGDYSKSPYIQAAGTWTDHMAKIIEKSPYKGIYELLRNSKEGFGFMPEEARENVLKAAERAIAAQAVHVTGVDARGVPASFEAMREYYKDNARAMQFLKHLVVDTERDGGKALRIVADYRKTDMTDKDLQEARWGFGGLSADDQGVLAEYVFQRFGIGSSTMGGSYLKLLGSSYRKSIDAKLSKGEITDAIKHFMLSYVPKKEAKTEEASAEQAVEPEEYEQKKSSIRFFDPEEPLQGATDGKPISTPTPESPKAPTSSERVSDGPLRRGDPVRVRQDDGTYIQGTYWGEGGIAAKDSVLVTFPDDPGSSSEWHAKDVTRIPNAEAPTASQRIVGPVVRDPVDQSHVVEGTIGQTHDEVADADGLPKIPEKDRGFKMSDGSIMWNSRAEAMKIAKESGQVAKEFAGEIDLHSHMLDASGSRQVAKERAHVQLELAIDKTHSLTVDDSTTDITKSNEVRLKFAWRDKLLAIPERVRKQQTLTQMLDRAQLPKDAKTMLLDYAKTSGKTDLADIVNGFEKDVLKPLTISPANTTWDGNVETADVYSGRSYERLSVNAGQGQYAEYFIKAPFAVPGQHGNFQDPNLAGWFRVREFRPSGETDEWVDNGIKVTPASTANHVEINEIQSELFQKNKGGFGSGYQWEVYQGHVMETGTTRVGLYGTKEEALAKIKAYNEATGDNNTMFYADVREVPSPVKAGSDATFLNLLAKDQNWVPVFVQSIMKWAEGKGFSKVRFPTGETAAKVEGHQVLADRLNALMDEKKNTEAAIKAGTDMTRVGDSEWTVTTRALASHHYAALLHVPEEVIADRELPQSFKSASYEYEQRDGTWWSRSLAYDYVAVRPISIIDRDISELKSQGIEKLAPIEAFYQNRVGSIVKRLGAEPITDANGNTWMEVTTRARGEDSKQTFAARAGETVDESITNRHGEMADSLRANLSERFHRRNDIIAKMLSFYPEKRAQAAELLRKDGSPEALRVLAVYEQHQREGRDTHSMDIGNAEDRTYAMRMMDDSTEDVQRLDTGKYGVHRAYFEAMDMLKARMNTAAGKADAWSKVLPKKQRDAWEAITREIDSPGTLEATLKARPNLEKVFTPEVMKLIPEIKKAYDEERDMLNKHAKGFTNAEWLEYAKDYINRVYVTKSPDAMKNLARSLDSKHTKERRIPTIAEAEKLGFTLSRTNAAELFEMYVADTSNVELRRSAIHKVMMIRNGSGDMQIVPVFKGGRHERPELSGYETPSMREAAEGHALSMGDVMTPTSTWEGIREVLAKMTGKKDFRKDGYTFIESPYEEYAGFYVHPDSLNVGKMLFDKGYDNRAMTTISRINNWSKFMTLGLSLFHPFALWEATVSALHGEAFKMKGIQPKFAWNADATFKAKMKDEEFQRTWISHGLSVTPNPNVDNGMISRDLNAVMAWSKDNGNKAVYFMANSMLKYKEFVDKHLWTNFHSQVKLYTAEHLYMKMKAEADQAGRPWDEKLMREEISKTINQGFGGLNFDRMMFATPKVRQMIHTFMFAPDWTLTNFTSARAGLSGLAESTGLTKLIPGMEFLGKDLTPTQKKWALTVHWPAMLTFMLAWPNVIQAAIYAAFGDDSKGDKAFAAENETGKEFTVDVTPLFRRMGFVNKDNPAERNYMRFAKQAWEVADMAMNPIQSLKGKSSAAFRIAYEQVTGDNTLGRKYSFADENLWSGMFGSDKGWVESRAGTITEKFVPMSVLTLIGGQPPTFLAPVSKGMTRAKAEIELARTLTAYADPSVWAEIVKRPGYEQKLDKLVPEIIDAARRNGVNVEEAMKTARSHVLSKYYDRFWRALNRDNASELEEYSQSIVRLHGTLQGLEGSLKAKEGRLGHKPAPVDLQKAREYYLRSYGEIAPPGASQTASWTDLKPMKKTIAGYLAGQ